MGYYRLASTSLFMMLAATACGRGDAGCGCPPPPVPVPSLTQGPSTTAKATALPSPGTLVTFPTNDGMTGSMALPSYTAPPGTLATFSTFTGPAAGDVPQAKRRSTSVVPAAPAAIMSLGMSVSQPLTLATLPTIVFAPGASAGTGPFTLEVFDAQTHARLAAVAQGPAPSGIIGFSDNGDASPNLTPLDLIANHLYAFELVANSALSLPSPGPVCGEPPPVPAPYFVLVSPSPSATGVSPTLGALRFQGDPNYYFGPITVSLKSAAGTTILANATPLADTVVIPALAPDTQYVVSDTFPDFSDVPPVCRAPNTQTLGSFTTGS